MSAFRLWSLQKLRTRIVNPAYLAAAGHGRFTRLWWLAAQLIILQRHWSSALLLGLGGVMWSKYSETPFVLPPKHAMVIRCAAGGLSAFIGWADWQDDGSE